MQARITARQATHDACDFTARAWRGAWAVQALFAVGLGLLFVSRHAGLTPSDAADMASIGWAVTLTVLAPLAAALLRIRLGGDALAELGPGGLQFGKAELRLLVVAAAWSAAVLLAWLPLVAVSAVLFVVLSGAGSVDLPLIGATRTSFAAVGATWIVAAFVFIYAAVRLTLAAPATIAARRLVLFEAWGAGARRTGALMGALLATAAPLAMTAAVALLLDYVASLGGARLFGDAVMAAAVFACVLSFVQAPLTVGVLGAVYAGPTAAPQADRPPNPAEPLLESLKA